MNGLGHLTITDLTDRCREETQKFTRREESSEAFCFELFRRAVCDRVEAAWEAVLTQYRGLVLAWVRTHPAVSAAQEDDAYWVNRTFERFWVAVGAERFGMFAGLAALLRYLKMCAHSVLLDDVRGRAAAHVAPLPEHENGIGAVPDVSEGTVGALATQALWEAIRAETRDDAEEQIAYLCLVLDMKPREIFDRYPETFSTVDDVYRIKRNLLDRLRRSPAIREFLA